MKILIPLIAVLLIFALLIRPSGNQPSKTSNSDILNKKQVNRLLNTDVVPLSSDDLKESNWKEFTPIEGGITIRLPGKPEVLDYNIPNIMGHGYIFLINNDENLVLTSFKYHIKKSQQELQEQYKSIENSLIRSASRPRILLDKKDYSSHGLIEKELILEEEWVGGYSKIIIFVTKERSHSIQYFAPKKELLDSAVANYYFSSVKISE